MRALIAERRRFGIYYNVNFPLGPAETVSGVRVVPHQRFTRSPIAYYPSRNDGKFFIAIPVPPQDLSPEADFHVLHSDRAITVTPLSLDQSDLAATTKLQAQCEIAFAASDRSVKPEVREAGSGGEGDEVRYKPDPSATAR